MKVVLRLLLVLVLVLVAAAGWIAWTGDQARSELVGAREDADRLWTQVRSGDVEGARTSLAEVQRSADRAADLTTDPVWWLAARLPWVGDDLGAVTTLTGAMDTVASDVAGPLVEAGDAIDLTSGAPVTDDQNRLGEAVSGVVDADDALESARLRVLAIPSDDLVGPVADARQQVLDALESAGAVLGPLADLARLADQVAGQQPGG